MKGFSNLHHLSLLEKQRCFLRIKEVCAVKIRCISTSYGLRKTIPTNSKSSSSHEWLTRQLNDQYCIKSRYDKYRCRSAYKLIEMNEKYRFLKPGLSVVDCGAAPGSWTQVVVKQLKLDEDSTGDSPSKGIVVAVDLQEMKEIKGAIIVKESDFTHASVQDKIWSYLPNKKADVILSDMAPKATGTYDLDSSAISNLVFTALRFAVVTLKKDGTFLCKIWECHDIHKLVSTLQNLFHNVKRVKPRACRTNSSESYILARGFKSEILV